MLGIVKKQPSETIDVDIDFSVFLPETDTILQVTSVSDVVGLDIPFTDIVESGKTAKVWLSAGIDATEYKVTTTITTTGGRVIEVEFKVKVKEV